MGWPAAAKKPTLSLAELGKSVAWQERGLGGELLSAVELGATEERDFAPEGQWFFQDIGQKIQFLILLVLLTFTFTKGWKSVE